MTPLDTVKKLGTFHIYIILYLIVQTIKYYIFLKGLSYYDGLVELKYITNNI